MIERREQKKWKSDSFFSVNWKGNWKTRPPHLTQESERHNFRICHHLLLEAENVKYSNILTFLRVYNPVSTLIKLWFNIDKSFNFDELQVRFILANITSLSGILRFYHLFTLCNSSLFILHHRRLIHNHHTETIYNKRSKYGHENSNINNQPFIHRKDGIKRITA